MIKKRLYYGFLIFLSIVFYIFFVDYLSFFVLLFVLVLPIMSLLEVVLGIRKINIELVTVSFNAKKNEAIPYKMTVSNRSFLIRPQIKITLKVCNYLFEEELTEKIYLTAHFGTQVMEQEIVSSHCGRVVISISEVRIYDRFGLFSICKKVKSLKCEVFVMPNIFLIEENENKPYHKNTDLLKYIDNLQTVKEEDPFEISDFHEYKKGENTTRIHWKLSERFDKLIIKEFSLAYSESTAILLELYESAPIIDSLLNTFATISLKMLEEHKNYNGIWYNSRLQTIESAKIHQIEDYEFMVKTVISECSSETKTCLISDFDMLSECSLYSQVLYLCSKLEEKQLDILSKIEECQLHIILVTQSANSQNEIVYEALARGLNISVIESIDTERDVNIA